MTRHERDTAVNKMLDADPAMRKAVVGAWSIVSERIKGRALLRRPRPTSYEVHHEVETARNAYLNAVLTNKMPHDATTAALNSVSLS